MLFLKRLLTAIGLFVVLSIVFFLGGLMVAGAAAGAGAARASNATDFQSGYAAGHAAGEEVGRKYGATILLGSVGMGAVTSIAISFSGVFPWCRRKPQPPPLPAS